MVLLSYALFLVLPAVACAGPVATAVGARGGTGALTVHESRDLPSAFVSLGKPDTDTTIQLRVGLKAKDTSGLEKTLYDVSTPGSDSYGKYLSFDDVKNYAAPTPETVSLVASWLNSSGISNVQTSGAFNDWLIFSTDLSTADTLLNANFETYIHTDSGENLIRTLQYSLPEDLLPYIDLVHPTTTFATGPSSSKSRRTTTQTNPILGQVIGGGGAQKTNSGQGQSVGGRSLKTNAPQGQSIGGVHKTKTKRTYPAPSSCDAKSQPEPGLMNPKCLQEIYGIPATPATQSSNRIAVAGFDNEYAQIADLQGFLTEFRPDMSPNTTFTLQTIDGGENPQGPGEAGVEASIDIDYTVGLATNVSVFFISAGNDTSEGADGFLDMANFLNAQDDPPQVLTTSYGSDEPKLSSALEVRICNAYMALAARGVSILFSSGDGGVSGNLPNDCTTFISSFPSSCPYVTSVGATYGILSNETVGGFTSGGFSNVFPTPPYQSTAVSSYLSALGNTNAGLYNASGRGFPDVAADGINIQIFNDGKNDTVGGTSVSTPIFASVVALLNDRLLAAGKPVLGFLNPLLYQNPQVLFDITVGDNPGCNTSGFPAMAGWDPVSGLGTPNFPAMLELVMS